MRTAILLLAVVPLLADQVTLTNGDRLTGHVVKKEDKTLTFKTEALGTVTIPWDKVQTLKTDDPVHVTLTGDRSVTSPIETKEDKVAVGGQQASLADLVTVRDDAEQKAYERLLSPGWTNLWAGTASLGYSGTQGNADTTTFTVGLNAARVTRTDKTTVQFNAIRASAMVDGLEGATARAVRGGWAYNRNIYDGLFINTFNDFEYDRFQALDLRVVLGGGLGYTPWKSDRGRLDILGGGAWNREAFTDTPEREGFTRTAGELYFGNDWTFKLNAVTSMFQNLRIFPNLSETGEYRLNLDLGATTRLTRWLTWNVALSNRRLSNPVQGRQPNDILYTTGLGISFSR